MEYDFEKFAHSWKDSKYFMMATDEAAPYQYDAENHCMQISNFATDFSVQEFPFHNEFTDIWQVDDLGYVPYYSNGHLLSITDDLSYDDFNYAFNSDSFETLDDSFNIDDIDDSWSHVEFTDNKIVTDIQPMDNLFDYSSESMIDDMSLSCDS